MPITAPQIAFIEQYHELYTPAQLSHKTGLSRYFVMQVLERKGWGNKEKATVSKIEIVPK